MDSPLKPIDIRSIIKLFTECFSLFGSSFLIYFITNFPKYYIDITMDVEIQGYYGYISMPVFVIELLNCFIYQPQIVKLANEWNKRNFIMVKKRYCQQIVCIILLSVLVEIIVYICGVEILSLVFGTDISIYKKELLIIMLAGCAFSIVSYSGVILTTMRKQKIYFCNMLLVSLLTLVVLEFIKFKELRSIVFFYVIVMIILSIVNVFSVVVYMKKAKKEKMI